MHIINRLIKLANKIDQKDPKLADKLEKTAYFVKLAYFGPTTCKKCGGPLDNATDMIDGPAEAMGPFCPRCDPEKAARYKQVSQEQTAKAQQEGRLLWQRMDAARTKYQTADPLTRWQMNRERASQIMRDPFTYHPGGPSGPSMWDQIEGFIAPASYLSRTKRQQNEESGKFYNLMKDGGFYDGTDPIIGGIFKNTFDEQYNPWYVGYNNGKLIGQSRVSNSINMIKNANAIDKENPKLADRLEKTAANMLNMYVPQNVLEQGWGSAGGGNLAGDLGGFHTQLQLNTPGLDQTSKDVAVSLIGELANQLPPYEQWVAAHQHLGADPQAVYQALGIMQQLYQMGVQDPSYMGQALAASGPLDLQFASKQPSAAHRSWGITPQEIMQHEVAHAQGKSSTPEAYMQRAVPGADFINTKGIGGNVNPVAGYYQSLMKNFMGGQGKGEYGPNLDIWSRVVKEKAPKF